ADGPAGGRAPLLAIVSADAADGTDRDAVLDPRARCQGEPEHSAEHVAIARFVPQDAPDFGVDVRGNEGRYSGVMAREAEGEVILELFIGRECGCEDVLPAREDAEEPVGRLAEPNQAAGFGVRQAKEGRGVLDLRDKRLGGDEVGPGGLGERGGQISVSPDCAGIGGILCSSEIHHGPDSIHPQSQRSFHRSRLPIRVLLRPLHRYAIGARKLPELQALRAAYAVGRFTRVLRRGRRRFATLPPDHLDLPWFRRWHCPGAALLIFGSGSAVADRFPRLLFGRVRQVFGAFLVYDDGVPIL